ncbi:MAG TPA: aminoglycoside phosphotransferase family protein [Rhodanobacteraceae bacterium]|nr:aminoglycoside phosphotransferase family protein [Rhodanobacteraceae bacterium]
MNDLIDLEPATRAGLANAWGLSPRARFSLLGNGLINRTLLMQDDGRKRVMQCLNAHVFRDPGMVMRNCHAVTAHLGHKRAAGHYDYSVLELVPTLAGGPAAVLADKTWWRMYDHVPDTRTFEIADDPALTFEAGRGFGAFAAALGDLDHAAVGEVIPHFHDPIARFTTFRAALEANRVQRAADARPECEAALAFEELLAHWRTLLDARLPWRITHNDCKLNNLLFDADHRAICVVDLDTVMPGTPLFDFGDMARTMLSPVPEDSTDVARVEVRHDHFAALARGYIEGCGALLTPLERDNLVFAARLVTGVIGLRFLTDYLDGDRYFRITHPTHNLERSRNQFALFAALTADADALQKLIPDST